MAEISLWLDTYDDIYSDFDSRHYLKRRISEDLLEELRTALKYRRELPESLVLMLPAEIRDAKLEDGMVAGIKEQFLNRLNSVNAERKKHLQRGLLMLLSGIMALAADAAVVHGAGGSYFITLIRVIMEPAGWFLIWTGLDQLIYQYRKAKKELTFYRILYGMHIRFTDL